MKLTRKQKLAVENLKNLPTEEIAQALNLPIELVKEHLSSRGYRINNTDQNNYMQEDSAILDVGLKMAIKKFRRDNQRQILLVVLLGFLVYITALGNGFVSDDLPLLKSPYLANPVQQLIDEPVSAFINSSTYTLNYLLNGTNPLGYHFINVLLHVLLTIVIFFFLSLLFTKRLSFFASLLFLVSPLHSEAVFWVSGRHYILYSVFTILTLICHIFASKNKGLSKYRVWSILFFIFSVYSFPEQGLITPLLILLIDFYRGDIKNNLKNYWPYFLLAGIFTVLSLSRVLMRVQNVASDTNPLLSSQTGFILRDVVALTSYLQLFLIPFGLTFYHESFSINQFEIILKSLILILIVVLPFYLYFKKENRFLLFCLGLFVISLLPTISPLKVSWLVAERYAYLATLGLALFLANLLNIFWENPRYSQALKSIFVILIIIYSTITFLRGFDWKNEDSLWIATAKASPTSSKAWNNMGDYYGRQGDMQKSFESFVKATQLNPTYSDAWHNAGNTLVQVGKYDEAIPYFEKSLQFNPNLIEAYNNLALVYHKKDDEEKSRMMIEKSLQINSRAVKTYVLLAQIEYENKNLEKAIGALRTGLALDPTNEVMQKSLQNLEQINPQTLPSLPN